MALCTSTIVIGQWLVHDDIMKSYPKIIKVSFPELSVDPSY